MVNQHADLAASQTLLRRGSRIVHGDIPNLFSDF